MKHPLIYDSRGRVLPRSAFRAQRSSPYEGGAKGPRFGGIYAPNLGVNAALLGSLETLRARCRDLARNDAIVWKALNSLVANLVGSGVTPHPVLADVALSDTIEAAWMVSSDELPVDEREVYAQQAAAVRAYLVDGEVLGRRRPRDDRDGFYVPLQVQLLEADHLPIAMNEDRANGNVIRAAKEFNRFGQLEAFHVYRNHPADALFGSTANVEIVRVPAAEMLHLYRIDRPGQLRGEPLLGRIILSAYDTANYDDATLQLMTIASCLTGFRIRAKADEDEEDELESATEDALEFGPAVINDLDPEEDIKFAQPPSVGGTYADYKKQQNLRICAGMNVTYEDGTGDHGDATFSSMKGADRAFRRWAAQQVHNVIVPAFCLPIWRWWMDAAVASGVLRLPGYATRWREYQAVEWRPEGFTSIQPREDGAADIEAIAACLKSPQEVIRDRGEDPRRVQRDIEAWAKWRQSVPGLSLPTPGAAATRDPDESPNQRKQRREAARRQAHA